MNFDLTITAGVLVSAFGSLITWMRLRNEAQNKRLEGQSARLDRHDARLSAVEQTLQTLPASQDLHRVELALERIGGDMREMRASMSGQQQIMVRLESVVTRQEDHLMKGSGR